MIQQTKHGFWILANDSHVGAWAVQQGRLDHDQSMLPIALDYVPPGGTVVDCGAFVGDHTIAYLRKVGPEGTVIAIESNPEAFVCLKLNCPQATCLQVALSDHFGNGELIPAADQNYGTASIKEGAGNVSVITLDSLCIPKVHFLKVDCEGMELKILRGAKRTIEQTKPVMLLEVNEGALNRNATSGVELLSCIQLLGYDYKNVFSKQPCEGPQYDVLCIPK